MLYYVVLWFVRRFAEHKPLLPFILCCIGVIVWFCLDRVSAMEMFGNNYFRWMYFFLFMLAGAYAGNGTLCFKSKPGWDSCLLLLSVVAFYGIQFMGTRVSVLGQLQILSIIPLMGVAIYGYKLCCCEIAVKIMHTKLAWWVRLIAGLCLDAYIVQVTLIPLLAKSISSWFPFSLAITFIVVMLVAYLSRCLGRFFSQLFENEDMNWKMVFEFVS